MARELLSLREIGRRLDVPPSSIVYYKDRFARFIPTAGGKGRRLKYPPEAVTLFKEIREMFERNLSAEEIESHLSENDVLAGAYGAGRGVDATASYFGRGQAESGSFVQELSGVLEKMSGVLEAQAGFRDEIQSLRREVAALRSEREEQALQHKQQISELEKQIEFLRKAKAFYAEDSGSGSAGQKSSSAGQQRRSTGFRTSGVNPPASFLGRPLVIHRGDEYIGVVGRGKPFTLAMLIRLIERNAGSQKVCGMEWRRDNDQWLLIINSQDEEGTQKHEHELRVVRKTTPSGNTVTQLCRLRIDGDDVPENFLLALFKSIKDGLES